MGKDTKAIVNYKVRKNNKLVNARSSFTLLQYRIILLMQAKLNFDKGELEWMEIPIREVAGIAPGKKVSGSYYREVKEAAKGLSGTTLFIQDKSSGHWESVPFVRADGNDYEGVVRVKFVEEAKDLVMKLNLDGEGYTEYFLQNAFELKSVYAIRLYELCAQYYPNIEKRKLTFQEIREKLDLEDSYGDTYELKRRVINRAVKEINKNTDLWVAYEPDKKRNAQALIFTIKHNPNYQYAHGVKKEKFPEIEDVNHEVVESAPAASGTLSDEQFLERLRGQHGAGLVDFAWEKVSKDTKVKNARGYVLKGMRQGWFKEEYEQGQQAQQQQQVRLKAEQKVEEAKAEAEKYREAYRDFYEALKERYLQQISEEDVEEFLFEQRSVALHPAMRKYIDEVENATDIRSLSVQAKAHLCGWYVRRYGERQDQELMEVKAFARKKGATQEVIDHL